MKSGKKRSKGTRKFPRRLATTHAPTSQGVAFAWYDAQQWARLRDIAVDAEALDDTYDDWLKQAEDAVAELGARGVHAEKVAIDVDAAAAWSAARGRPFNSRARAEYVAEVARELAEGNEHD